MVALLLMLLATGVAAVVAYGTSPGWVAHAHGLQVIMVSRRLEWPLTFLAIILCVALVGWVVGKRRRVFWLAGLVPVALLLFRHFSGDPLNAFAIVEDPPFVSADQAGQLVSDGDYVVGVKLGDSTFAYPYAELYTSPVVLQVERGKRMLLMWSAFANRATAVQVDRDIRAREMDIVSMPANAILLYNGRLGQFINGVTCRTPKGEAVTGVIAPMQTWKTTWKQWKALHPETKVMALAARYASGLPKQPVLPYFKVPGTAHDEVPAETRITIIGAVVGGSSSSSTRAATMAASATQPSGATSRPAEVAGAGGAGGAGSAAATMPAGPVAVESGQITEKPGDVTAGGPVVVYRDPNAGIVRAFERRLPDGTVAEFRANTDPARANVALVDTVTGTGWSWAGVAVDGDKKYRGQRLTAVPVEDELYYGVMKYWYPELRLEKVTEATPEMSVAPTQPTEKKPARVRRTHRRVRRR